MHVCRHAFFYNHDVLKINIKKVMFYVLLCLLLPNGFSHRDNKVVLCMYIYLQPPAFKADSIVRIVMFC